MAITTVASLVAAQDSDNILKTQSTVMSNDPLSQKISLGDSPRSQETMGVLLLILGLRECLKSPMNCLSQKVLNLDKEKDAQAVEILKLKQRVKKLERKRKSRILHPRRRIYKQVESSDDDLDEEDACKQGRERETVHTTTTGVSTVSAPITTAGVAISTAEPRTPSITAATTFIDEDFTISQTLIKMKEEKAKEKGVAIKDVEESLRTIRSITTLQPLLTIDPKDKAQRLHEEELAELDRAQKERQKQEEATSAALA
ncbi:hypothetical protein Tco_1119721 [Tanacetum coccineum]